MGVLLPNGIYQPAIDEVGWGEGVNDNWDLLDDHIAPDTSHIRVSEPPPLIHVSATTGDDAFDGRWDRPLLTPQAAIDALPAQGGTVKGLGAFSHTGLVLKSGLTFEGYGGRRALTNSPTRLVYTPSGAGIALDGRDCQGVTLKNMAIQYNSSTFTGKLVDFSKVSTTPVRNSIKQAVLGGESSAANGATLIYLPSCINSDIEEVFFDYCNIGILGREVAGDLTNGICISKLDTRGSGAQTVWIKNLGQACTVRDSTFEPVAGGNPGAYYEDVVSHGLSWIANGCYDTVAGQTGSWLNFTVATLGAVIQGGRMAISTAATGVRFGANNTQGIAILGVHFNGSASGKAIDWGALTGLKRFTVLSNVYTTGVVPITGAAVLTNSIVDNGTTLTVYA
jgi:hypothetical protein